MIQQIQSSCTECGGEGHLVREQDRCRKCKGYKVVQERKVLEIFVDKGMKHNQKIVFSNEGDQEPGIIPGDVVILLNQEEHPVLLRLPPFTSSLVDQALKDVAITCYARCSSDTGWICL